jgi:hypothetical protein
MDFKPNQRVYYVHRYEGRVSNLPGIIKGPGWNEGTWRVWLENHRLTITAIEDDLIPIDDRDY